jgi:replicative DNA helicase
MRNNPNRFSMQDSIAMSQSKVLPNETPLEEVVLGACLQDLDALHSVIPILKPHSFYKIEHEKIFNAMSTLYAQTNPVDIMTVVDFLKKSGELEMVGGAYFISKLTDRVGNGSNAEFHARIIQQSFIKRELIRVSGDLYNMSFEDTSDALEILDHANNEILSIGTSISGKQAKSNKDLVLELIEKSELAASGVIQGLRTGLLEADKLTGGFTNGHFIVLAARPGMGKTAKALQEAYEFAVAQGRRVLFFSVEMSAPQLMLRLMSYHTGIPAYKIRTGQLSVTEWGIINEMSQEIIASKLVIIDDCLTKTEIRNRIISENIKEPVELVYVDYLQRVQNNIQGGSREQVVADISTTFANLAKYLNIPLVALAQLGRDLEKRGGNKRPQLSDLRESGQLEMDAHVVVFLHRPEYYGIELSDDNLSTEGLAEYIVAKNRDGITGTANLKWNPETTSFADWDDAASYIPNPNTFLEPMPSVTVRSTQFDIPKNMPYKDNDMEDPF